MQKQGTQRSARPARSVPAAAPTRAGEHETEFSTIDTKTPALPAEDAETTLDALDPVPLDTADIAADPLAADPAGDLPVGETPDLDVIAAEEGLDEEELVADLDAAVVVEDDDEEEDDSALPATPHRVPPRMPGHMPGVPNRPIMHARMPAKAEIFHEGDHVVYPTHGVGKVERIATEEIAGHKLELIHITFEENRMTLRVPVSKARSAGLRKLATRKMFDEAMAILKGRARIKRTMWSRRAQEYEAKINSGDPLAIAEVVRDLHRNSGQPDQSFSERQIYEAAMDRLAAELAALDKTDKPTAVSKLGDFLKTV